MEASLPLSSALKPASTPSQGSLASGVTSASIALPLRFMLAGLLALTVGIVWLVLQPYVLSTYHYNQHVIAVTHLFVLGWISTIVMGAMYQLVPVALETRLYSERLAKWQFAFHIIGFGGMVWMFRAWDMKQVGHFGSVLGFGVLLFVYNIARTLLRIPKWNVVAGSVASALGWISVTILAGLSLAVAKAAIDPETQSPGRLTLALESVGAVVRKFDPISAMHAHAHLGVIGFFIMLIVGVSYKLIPMFTLSEVQSRRRAALSVILLNVGLLGSFVCILLKSPFKVGFAAMIAIALLIYAVEMAAIVRARKRGPIDWGIRYFLTAIVLLLLLAILGIVLSLPTIPLTTFTGQLENLYGFIGLIGVISFAIMGMLYKIIPFLIWFGTYSKHIGRARVPALADLYSPRLQAIGYWTFLAGVATTTVAILTAQALVVRIGCGALLISVMVLLANVGTMLRHYFNPRLVPLKPVARK